MSMKKLLLLVLALVIGATAFAQSKIQLRSADKAECTKSDMRSLKASFSFSGIDAENVNTKGGEFSWISMPNTVLGGNEGDPQIPVINELIAVPVGAQPTITVTSYSSTDYNLSEMGIGTLIPRQPSLRKDQRPEDVPFVKNEAAYQTRGMRSEPQAMVKVEGTMRGVQLGKMTIEPVSYDPVSNTIRVFNDIEVEVSFNGADTRATEQMLVDTYSPYFNVVYKQLFNSRAITSIYDQHPDLYTTPVRMLVITTSTYANNTTFQNWVTWKKQKGFYIDVYTTSQTGTSASNIQSFIQTQYNQNRPTFLVIVGDSGDVVQSATGSASEKYTDLYYSSVDGDIYPDIYTSRMPVSSSNELTYLLNKILQYEQYTMPDPSYLDETLLIAGWDSYWTNVVGIPTIQYANTYYINSNNGITPHVYLTSGSQQSGCYTYINQVGFVNYTAHGSQTSWQNPEFTVSNVNSLTNTNKYFWAMGNCCLAADWGYSGTCYAEAMLRAQNKGAFTYIGSCPSTYWWEDYYFGVGATTVNSSMPTQAQTQTGVYDAMFADADFNTLNAVPFFGNLAVCYAHAGSYENSISSGATDTYYWEAYHCLGDGSVMPYHKNPSANPVSHDNQIVAGTNSFRVNADAGSYVSITVNNEIIGVAAVPANATYVDVPFTTTPVAGTTAMIVVTRNQRQPYINDNVPVINNNAPQYTITANVNNAAWGSVEGAGTYYENTNCTLTAVANHGYAFQRWNDNNTENPRTITVTGNATYTAYFRQLEEHHITFNPTQNHGTISVSPANAYAGDIVTLTAYPAAGYMLDHWTVTTVSKEVIPVDENNQFVMPDSEVNITATFKLEPVDLTVYNGTATNQYIPMYGYYFDEYTKSEFIIPATELEDMVGGTITAITFYPSNVGTTNSSWGAAEQTVFLKEVSSTTLGGSYSGTTGATTVKVGSPLDMPTAGTAYTITFDTPYTYQGGNLLIGVYNNKGSYNKVEWYGTSNLTSGVSAYGNNSSSLNSVSYNAQAFLPKTTFTYTASEGFCAKPENLHIVGEIGPRSVTMGWDVAAGDVFQYAMVQDHGIDLTTVTYDGTTSTGEMTWNNLTADSDYTVVIRRKCDTDNYSQPTSLEIHTAVACPAPTGLAASDFTSHGATFTWTGFSDSYVFMVGEPTTPGTVFNANFESGDLSGLGTITNDATYPWVITTAKNHTGSGSYCMKSSNEGQNSTTSSIEVSVNLANDGTLSFYCWASCESASSVWDYGIFYIDGDEQDKFLHVDDWVNKTYNLSAGQHTLKWTYSKDSSAAGNDDCFYVDDITITGLVPSTWSEYTANTNSITINDLSTNTYYFAKVKGNCGSDGYSQDSDMIDFTTLESCPTPTGLTVDPSSITAHEASLSWTADNDSYNIMLGELTYLVDADFETGDFSQANFTNDANYPWTVVANTHSGAYCVKSASGNNSQTSALELEVTLTAAQTLTFSAKVSSESGYDEAFFSIDGTNKINGISGAGNWIDYQYTLAAGTHTLRWYYTKDSSVASNDDCFYVDDIKITGEPNVLATYTSNTTSYDLTGLSGETTYTVQVQGVCGSEPTGWSDAVSFTTLVSCPAPTVLTAGTPGGHSVELSWTENGSATAWQICLNGDETNLINADANPFTLTGLTPETAYTAKVRAYCDATDQSIWSNTVTFTTDVACTAPTGLDFGTPGNRSVELSWTNGEDGQNAWQICVNDDETNLINVTTNPYILTSLEPATTYTAKVRANCGVDDGVSAWSNTVTFTTDVACPAPKNVVASNLTQNSAVISWNGEAESYTVQYRPATITGTTQTELFTEDFENGLSSWTTFALGFTGSLTDWQLYDATDLGSDYNNTNHSGDYVVRSKSYAGSSGGDVTIDNWLISPQMTIGDGMSLWVSDDGRWHEHIEVRVCTKATYSSSSLTTDFTLVSVLADAESAWTQRTVDLSAYAGQTGYIAIRNNDTGKDYILIDDIVVYETVNTYSYGTENTINTTANSCNLTGLTAETLYEVMVKASYGSEGTSDWSRATYFTTPDACSAPTDLVASNVTATTATLGWANTQNSYNLRYRKVYFYEGFESESMPTGWTTIDANGDGNTWGIGFATAHTGNNGAYNLSYIYNTTGTTPDDYLVTPQLDLQGTLRVWLSGYGNDSYEEHFAIYVSTSGNTAADFTTTLVGETTTTNNYVEYTADLSSYAGQKGYIAIRHFNCTDQYYLYVDDFGLYGSEDWVTVNPTDATVTLTGLTPNTGYEWQVQGVDCNSSGSTTEWSAVATFTTPNTMTQEIALSSGSNWVSFNVDITLDNLKTALVAALPGTQIVIKAKNNEQLTYTGSKWKGNLASLDVAQMYMIQVASASTISVEGLPVVSAGHPVTIVHGANWIAFPLSTSMTPTEAFAGFALTGDVIKNKDNQSAAYNGTKWKGSLTTLEPGKGYVFTSSQTTDRTLVFPSAK